MKARLLIRDYEYCLRVHFNPSSDYYKTINNMYQAESFLSTFSTTTLSVDLSLEKCHSEQISKLGCCLMMASSLSLQWSIQRRLSQYWISPIQATGSPLSFAVKLIVLVSVESVWRSECSSVVATLVETAAGGDWRDPWDEDDVLFVVTGDEDGDESEVVGWLWDCWRCWWWWCWWCRWLSDLGDAVVGAPMAQKKQTQFWW